MFKTLNIGDGLSTIEYAEQKATKHCEGCFANGEDSAMCLALPDSCLTDGLVFVRRFVEVTDCV